MECLYNGIQVTFAQMSCDALTLVPNFDIDDLFAGLDSPGQLGVDTLAYQDYFNHGQMCQMGPADGCKRVKRVSHEIRYVSKR